MSVQVLPLSVAYVFHILSPKFSVAQFVSDCFGTVDQIRNVPVRSLTIFPSMLLICEKYEPLLTVASGNWQEVDYGSIILTGSQFSLPSYSSLHFRHNVILKVVYLTISRGPQLASGTNCFFVHIQQGREE